MAGKDEGNLHVQEEFGKAKRNALWFCSLAVLLWLVHAPEGNIQAPMLGAGAKVSAYWLRVLVWVGAVYCVIGFWRQARNVDRLNSELLYTRQFEHIEVQLTALGDKFMELTEQCERLRRLAAPVTFACEADFESGPSKILAGIQEAVAKVEDQLRFALSAPQRITKDAMKTLYQQWQHSQKGIELVVQQKFRELRAANKAVIDEMTGVADIGEQGQTVSATILELRTEFHKLNGQIRGEHRLMYMWYDKYLTYLMFLIATLATWHEYVVIAGSYWVENATDLFSGHLDSLFVYLLLLGGVLMTTAVASLLFRFGGLRGTWRRMTARFALRRLIRRARDRGDIETVAKLEALSREPYGPLVGGEIEVAREADKLRSSEPRLTM